MAKKTTETVGSGLAAVLVVVAVVAWDPLGRLVRTVAGWLPDGLPHPHLPDLSGLPGWLHFLLGPGKLLVIGAVVLTVMVVAGVRQERRERQDDEE